MTNLYNNIGINCKKFEDVRFIEFPEYGLVIEFRPANTYVMLQTNGGYEYKGFCGTPDNDSENEISLPLDPVVYGSTALTKEPNHCKTGEELGSDETTCYNIEVTKEKCPSASDF